MKPRGPLMIEHRLIEKMLKLVEKEINNITITNTIDPILIDTLVDFIRIYADRTHHGKEELILFKELENKNLNSSDLKVMNELIEEHIHNRKIVGELVDANKRYIDGDSKSLEIIKEKLISLTENYPIHIRKEDDIFFPNTEIYFTTDELDKMLVDFWEFDRKMIHEKYKKLYEDLSKKNLNC